MKRQIAYFIVIFVGFLALKADPSIIDKYINIVLDKPYLRQYNEPKILTMKRYYAEVYE